MKLAALLGAAALGGCLSGTPESTAARQEQEPQAPAALERLCIVDGAPGKCAPRRESIAGRSVFLRNEPARQLFELMVRSARRSVSLIDDVDIDASMIPMTNDGVAFIGAEEEGYRLACWQIATDTVCDLRIASTTTASAEVFDGASLPAAGALALDQLEMSGTQVTAPLPMALAGQMMMATGIITSLSADPVPPADGVFRPKFGMWSCDISVGVPTEQGAEAAPESDGSIACRLSSQYEPVPAPLPAPAQQ